MKARYVGKCLFCTPCTRAIKIGDEVVRHPTCPENENGSINWVHRKHILPPGQQRLFGKLEPSKAFEIDDQHMRRDWGDF